MSRDLFDLQDIITDLEAPYELVEELVVHEIITPAEAEGGRRVTAIEADRIRVACHLVEVGVNIEGVDVALRLRERLLATQRQVEAMIKIVREMAQESSDDDD